MSVDWSDQKLLALAPEKLEVLRRNAVAKQEMVLAARIEKLQGKGAGSPGSPVIGFHFKCESDYEVTLLPDGRFWSGVWVVADDLCDPAIELKGYVALHASKREKSYRQGTIVDWKTEPRSKGKTTMGVSFLVQPFDEPLRWFGKGAGERGYRRLADSPPWVPRT